MVGLLRTVAKVLWILPPRPPPVTLIILGAYICILALAYTARASWAFRQDHTQFYRKHEVYGMKLKDLKCSNMFRTALTKIHQDLEERIALDAHHEGAPNRMVPNSIVGAVVGSTLGHHQDVILTKNCIVCLSPSHAFLLSSQALPVASLSKTDLRRLFCRALNAHVPYRCNSVKNKETNTLKSVSRKS